MQKNELGIIRINEDFGIQTENKNLINNNKELYPHMVDTHLIDKPIYNALTVMSYDYDLNTKDNKTHYLKSYIDRFQLLWTGKIRAEVRSKDTNRDYKEGDICILIEGLSDQGVWIGTGNVLSFKIKHVDTFGLGKDNVLLHYELLTKIFIKDIEKSIKELKQFGF